MSTPSVSTGVHPAANTKRKAAIEEPDKKTKDHSGLIVLRVQYIYKRPDMRFPRHLRIPAALWARPLHNARR